MRGPSQHRVHRISGSNSSVCISFILHKLSISVFAVVSLLYRCLGFVFSSLAFVCSFGKTTHTHRKGRIHSELTDFSPPKHHAPHRVGVDFAFYLV